MSWTSGFGNWHCKRVANKILKQIDEPSSLRDIKDFTAKDVFDEAKKGDELALYVVDKVSKYLVFIITHVLSRQIYVLFIISDYNTNTIDLANIYSKFNRKKLTYFAHYFYYHFSITKNF